MALCVYDSTAASSLQGLPLIATYKLSIQLHCNVIPTGKRYGACVDRSAKAHIDALITSLCGTLLGALVVDSCIGSASEPHNPLMHMQGYGHATDHGGSVASEGKSPSHIPSIQSIPEEQPLQIPPRSPSIESDFPPTPGSPGSTGFNTAQALIEAGDCKLAASTFAVSHPWP